MGDDLTISGGGSTAVATDQLFASAQLLHRLALEATTLSVELGAIERANGLIGGRAPASAARAEFDIDRAKLVLDEVEVESRRVGLALSDAAEAYGFIERFVSSLGTQLAGEGAALAGAVVAASGFGPLVGVGVRLAVRGLVDSHVFEGDPVSASHGPYEHNELLNNPLTAAAVRAAAMSIDDGVMTASGIPYPVARLLDGVMGAGGLAFASAALMGAGASVGLLTETSVRQVAEQSRAVSGPPNGFAERLERVPDPATNGGAQVVVDRYTMPDGVDRYDVYIGGTVTFSPEATTQPWDMTSNIANARGPGSGSYDAVVQAMRAAGVDDSSPVQLTGYSQGGGTAARLAASGEFTVVGLTTFGGPTGQVQIPASIPTVIIEHSDDIVPALGGVQLNQQALIVERDVFAGRDIPTDYGVPAHHIEYYEETARLMDAAASEQVSGAAARLDEFAAGATSVTSTAYTFERVDPSAAPLGRSRAEH